MHSLYKNRAIFFCCYIFCASASAQAPGAPDQKFDKNMKELLNSGWRITAHAATLNWESSSFNNQTGTWAFARPGGNSYSYVLEKDGKFAHCVLPSVTGYCFPLN